MKIVITNDDGVDAPGIEALSRAAGGLGELVVVAPDRPHSGCGHQVTTHAPFEVHRLGDTRYAVSGTPADCTRVALHDLVPEASLVLAGINSGGNLGVDVYVSGTVAAAREAAIHGVPAIAFSQYLSASRRAVGFDWERSAAWTRQVLERLIPVISPRPQVDGQAPFWNVNMPDPDPGSDTPEVVFCELDRSPLPVSFERSNDGAQGPRRHFRYDGVYHDRRRGDGTDVDHCFSGRIAITALDV